VAAAALTGSPRSEDSKLKQSVGRREGARLVPRPPRGARQKAESFRGVVLESRGVVMMMT
jgi:hypothetical protein